MTALRSLPLLAVLVAPSLAQTWIPGPAVPTAGNVPRALGTAVYSASGFFLMGGTPANAAGDAPVHKLIGSGWTATTPLVGSFLHGGAIVDELGQILVIGGVDAAGSLGDSYIWSEASGDDGGIEGQTNGSGAGFMLAKDDQGRVLSIGGAVAGNLTVADANGYVERYDAVNDAWTTLLPLPTPVADGAACNDGLGHVLVFGGFDASGVRTANVARYDLATGTWSDTAIADMPTARAGHRCALGPDGRIYVVGGTDANGELATVDVLDPVTGVWSGAAPMSTPRAHFGCAVDAAGYLWAIGGDNTNTSEKLFIPTCPIIQSGPDTGAAITGALATLSVDVSGSDPLTYQWRRDGIPLTNGPSGNGSNIVGADAATLTIQFPVPADAQHVYDCVVSNACGSVTSATATLALTDPPPLPSAFVAEVRHPAGATQSSMNAIDGGVIVGSAYYPNPTWGDISHPMLWSLASGSAAVDLTPANSVGGSASDIRGNTIVGWWWWPYYVPNIGTGYNRNAAAWTQSSPGTWQHHQMQPSGQEFGSIASTDGNQHVGSTTFDETSTTSDGRLWAGTSAWAVNMTPPVAWGCSVVAVDGGRQFGSSNMGYGYVHASMWQGSPSTWVDMHPAGASRSYVTDASDGLQAGMIYFGNTSRAAMWAGSPESLTYIDLPGHTVGLGATRYGLLLGQVDNSAAVLRGGPGEWLDLGQFLPAYMTSSVANDVWQDPNGGDLIVVGSAYNTQTGRREAVVWRSAGVASAVARLGQPTPVTLEFTPDGLGGYTVTRTSPLWFDDSAVGVELAAGGLLAADTVSAPQPLGFAFAMPGGSVTSTIRVDDNGRLLADPAATSQPFASSGLLRIGPASLAPFWTDLDSAAGSVRFHADPAGFATVTWRDVPQHGEADGFTFQVRLRSDGSFAFTYLRTDHWRTFAGGQPVNLVIGASAGNLVPDPGASDYRDYPIATAGAPIVYQDWLNANAPTHPELNADLHVLQHAIVGGSLEVAVDSVTANTWLAFLIVGLSDPAIDVTSMLTGMPGLSGTVLHSSLDDLLPMPITGHRAQGSLAVPNDPSLAGFHLQAQTLLVAPGESLLGLVLGDAVSVTIGG